MNSKCVTHIVLFIGFLISSISISFANETSDAITALQSAIEQEAKDKKNENNPQMDQMKAMFLMQLRSTALNERSPQLVEILNQISMSFKSAAVLQATAKLQNALKAEHDARDKALSTQVDTMLAESSKTVRSSKTPADLDETLDNLSHLQEKFESQNPEGISPQLMNKIRGARQFVTTWQDYLANRAEGNTQQALQNLQNLANNGSTDFIPRSEILAQIGQLPNPSQTTASNQQTAQQKQEEIHQKFFDIMGKTTNFDAIPSAIKEIGILIQTPGIGIPGDIIQTKDQLTSLLLAYQGYQAGLPSQLDFIQNPQNGGDNTLPLKVELLRLVIPQVLGVKDDQKPAPGETIQTYLDRMMNEAQQTADAKLIAKIRNLQDKLGGKQNFGNAPAFLQYFMAAQNQLEAGQFVPAVISYEATLKDGGDLVPSSAIGKQLEEIKKTHPEDYEKGMQLFLNNQYPAPPNNPTPPNIVGQPISVAIPGSPLSKTPIPNALPARP